jgi:superoxide dismutase, Cu-Zn family
VAVKESDEESMKLHRFAASAGLLLVVSACTADRAPAASPDSPAETGEQGGNTEKREAEAKIQSATGAKLVGDAKLVERDGAVSISVEVEEAPPGPKGIHIHQRGDCSDPKNKSMGEHFAPNQKSHGLPTAGAEHHLGDLGNITIGPDGKGRLEFMVAGANLKPGDPMSLVGKAVIIHEQEDTGVQPSGGAGDPIACGPINSK